MFNNKGGEYVDNRFDWKSVLRLNEKEISSIQSDTIKIHVTVRTHFKLGLINQLFH